MEFFPESIKRSPIRGDPFEGKRFVFLRRGSHLESVPFGQKSVVCMHISCVYMIILTSQQRGIKFHKEQWKYVSQNKLGCSILNIPPLQANAIPYHSIWHSRPNQYLSRNLSQYLLFHRNPHWVVCKIHYVSGVHALSGQHNVLIDQLRRPGRTGNYHFQSRAFSFSRCIDLFS